jgi:hypothetical protein
LPFEAERLPEVADPQLARNRQTAEAGEHVGESHASVGEVELRDPSEVFAEHSVGAEPGPAEAGCAPEVANIGPVGRALGDAEGVGLEPAPEFHGRLVGPSRVRSKDV